MFKFNRPRQRSYRPRERFNRPRQRYNRPRQRFNRPRQRSNRPRQRFNRPKQRSNKKTNVKVKCGKLMFNGYIRYTDFSLAETLIVRKFCSIKLADLLRSKSVIPVADSNVRQICCLYSLYNPLS